MGHPPDAVTKDGEYINNTKTQWAFKFDQVLPMDISQAQVFDRVGKNVVQNALDGYNDGLRLRPDRFWKNLHYYRWF